MVINTISVQHQVSKATTEIPPKNDDSETQGDATDIAKTICASDEGENKSPIFNLIYHPLVRISLLNFTQATKPTECYGSRSHCD